MSLQVALEVGAPESRFMSKLSRTVPLIFRRVRCAFSTHQIICRRWCVKRRDAPYSSSNRGVSGENENEILVTMFIREETANA